MSGVPRSQRLIGWASTGAGNSPSWVCPTGYITLVKTALVENASAAAGDVGIYFANPAFSDHPRIFLRAIAPADSAYREMWMVLNPGDFVMFSVPAAGFLCWLSGAVLAGPPQFPSS